MKNNFTPLDLKKIKDLYPSSSSKEAEPLKKEEDEIVLEKKTEFEPEEKKPYLEIKPKSIKLPPDLKKIGLETPPPTETLAYQKVKLPLSDEKIISGLHAPITSSLRWLATLAIYLLKIAHLQLKVVHGKVIRVFKS